MHRRIERGADFVQRRKSTTNIIQAAWALISRQASWGFPVHGLSLDTVGRYWALCGDR